MAKDQGQETILFVRIDQALDVPLYQQLRNEVVRGIAQEELSPGDALPSVRNLASDLGINLHTVNKAYALLRDEGYVEMKGRKGAFVAQPAAEAAGTAAAKERLSRDIHQLALAFKASGGVRQEFEQQVKTQLDEVFSEK